MTNSGSLDITVIVRLVRTIQILCGFWIAGTSPAMTIICHKEYSHRCIEHRKAREIYLKSISPKKLLQIVETGEILV